MIATGTDMRMTTVPGDWMEAYAHLHHLQHEEGLALHPPAACHYALNVVRHAWRNKQANERTTGHATAAAATGDEVADHRGNDNDVEPDTLTPEAVIEVFRKAVRSDFGPLRDVVLNDWNLRTPADLGQILALLGRVGCLNVDDGDAPTRYAADTNPFTGEPT